MVGLIGIWAGGFAGTCSDGPPSFKQICPISRSADSNQAIRSSPFMLMLRSGKGVVCSRFRFDDDDFVRNCDLRFVATLGAHRGGTLRVADSLLAVLRVERLRGAALRREASRGDADGSGAAGGTEAAGSADEGSGRALALPDFFFFAMLRAEDVIYGVESK